MTKKHHNDREVGKKPLTATKKTSATTSKSEKQHIKSLKSQDLSSPEPQKEVVPPKQTLNLPSTANLTSLPEPTATQLQEESVWMATPPPAKPEALVNSKSQNRAEPGKDLLASYIEGLSHIPLYTPELELENARLLESYEIKTWSLILNTPKAVLHLSQTIELLEDNLKEQINTLLKTYERAAERGNLQQIATSPNHDNVILKIATALRTADFDKDLLEKTMQLIRRDVWSRRVLLANPTFRLTHNDLTEIEQSLGKALRCRNNFVRANLRLVVSVARHFHHYRISYIDLIQEGNVGLMKAVHRYDHRRGFRFSTYAHWWIRQSIERAIINKGSQVRLPVHIIDSRRQVSRINNALTQSLGRTPTSEEISVSLNINPEKVDQILGGIQQDPVSLDERISHDDPRKFLDMVSDENSPAVDEALIRENTHAHVREVLQLLSPIEKDIIRRRFGLATDTDQTLDEIGKIYGLSRERVRQIQSQGLMKLRRMCERRNIE